MRKFNRLPCPKEFADKASQWNEQWARLRQANPNASFQWYTTQEKTARDWALPVLKDMTLGHCSFCDNFPLDDGDNPIEHLRPKSDPNFYHLAYSWENLYFCCSTCNSYKQEQFNDAVIAPDEEGYESLNFFYFDTTNGSIAPNPAASPEDRERARITIELFGLAQGNRNRLRRLEIQKWANHSTASELTVDDYAYRDFLS